MEAIALMGIDLGKRMYHVHAQDRRGHVVMRKAFNRSQLLNFLARVPGCRVVMEACAGAHWFTRKCWRALKTDRWSTFNARQQPRPLLPFSSMIKDVIIDEGGHKGRRGWSRRSSRKPGIRPR